MPWLEIIKNLSILFSTWIVICGIGAWRREFIGKRKIELVEDVLALFYEAKDAIHAIRSPFGFEGEGSTRKPLESERPEDKKTLDNAYVVIERYKKYQEIFNKLYAMRYRFMTQIGKDKAKPFDDLRTIVNEIFGASFGLALLRTHENLNALPQNQLEKHQEKVVKSKAIFWEGFADPDPINPRLEKVITEMEKICVVQLSKPKTLCTLFLNHLLFKKKNLTINTAGP